VRYSPSPEGVGSAAISWFVKNGESLIRNTHYRTLDAPKCLLTTDECQTAIMISGGPPHGLEGPR
jgi:hypothetical protein